MGLLIAIGWLALMVAGFYVLAVRPQRRRMVELRLLQDSLAVGDEVMISAGVYGRISAISDETIELVIAPLATVTVARGAVAMRVGDDEAESADIDAGDADGPAGDG